MTFHIFSFEIELRFKKVEAAKKVAEQPYEREKSIKQLEVEQILHIHRN